MRPSFLQDLSGQKFGRLTVLRMSERRTASRGGICVCQCECGTIKEIALSFMEKSGLVWAENNGAYYADYRHREDLLHSFKAQLKIKKID